MSSRLFYLLRLIVTVTYLHLYICIYTHLHLNVYTFTSNYLHSCIYTNVHTHTIAFTYLYIYICIYTPLHLHTFALQIADCAFRISLCVTRTVDAVELTCHWLIGVTWAGNAALVKSAVVLARSAVF